MLLPADDARAPLALVVAALLALVVAALLVLVVAAPLSVLALVAAAPLSVLALVVCGPCETEAAAAALLELDFDCAVATEFWPLGTTARLVRGPSRRSFANFFRSSSSFFAAAFWCSSFFSSAAISACVLRFRFFLSGPFHHCASALATRSTTRWTATRGAGLGTASQKIGNI